MCFMLPGARERYWRIGNEGGPRRLEQRDHRDRRGRQRRADDSAEVARAALIVALRVLPLAAVMMRLDRRTAAVGEIRSAGEGDERDEVLLRKQSDSRKQRRQMAPHLAAEMPGWRSPTHNAIMHRR